MGGETVVGVRLRELDPFARIWVDGLVMVWPAVSAGQIVPADARDGPPAVWQIDRHDLAGQCVRVRRRQLLRSRPAEGAA